MSAAMSLKKAASMGYSRDKRKRRRQHRKAANTLGKLGGGIAQSMTWWHKQQARSIR